MAKYRRGAAIDPLDMRCQNWNRCSKCIRMDSGGKCIPSAQNYRVNYDIVREKFACATENMSQCQMETCLCDVEFANRVVLSIDNFNEQYRLDKGWKPKDSCRVKEDSTDMFDGSNFGSLARMGNGRRQKVAESATQCCGKYPTRYPFSRGL